MELPKNQGALLWTPNSRAPTFENAHKKGHPIYGNSHMGILSGLAKAEHPGKAKASNP